MINIPKLKNDFNLILRLRTELQTKRDTLTEKLDEIREQYNELIKHNSKKIYLYCLDSLFFQYKILRVELEQFQKTISLIFNRMYGDYYKLYNIIQAQCKDNNVDILLSGENVVVYKDLDPLLEYNLDDLVLVHKIIVDTLNKLNFLYNSKQDEINSHNSNMRVGFSVTSFISTLSYENKLLGEQISLYSDYLTFYHSSQRKYCDNALYKINTFMREIEDDILTNHKTYKTESITIVESIVEETDLDLGVVEKKIEPVVEPKPEPVVEIKPEPIVEPKPEPIVEPKPEPVVEPVTELKPEVVGEPKQEDDKLEEEDDFQTVGKGKNGKNKKR
jgi:hypothetical protein